MVEVVLFHHAQGLTPGVRAFADEPRAAGHTVHTPDMYEGQTFGSVGVMPAQKLAQTRPGAKGALFFQGAMPPEESAGLGRKTSPSRST